MAKEGTRAVAQLSAAGDVLEMAYAVVEHIRTLLAEKGDVAVIDGQLYAGDLALRDASPLLDGVKADLGFGCSIFHGSERIATTALVPDGSRRAIGLHANEETTQQVFRCGRRHIGITHILGTEWVIVYAPLRDHQGKIVGLLAAYRQLQNYLHALELVDTTPEGLILHRPDGTIIDANRTACDMLALSKPELLRQTIFDFTVAPKQALLAAWQQVRGEPSRLETIWRRTDAYEFPVELSLSPYRLVDQDLVLTIARDFTQQHAARERLRELNAQLVHSEKMAALGNLVAGVTHDVNTPLGAIRSGHQTLTKATSKLKKTLERDYSAALESSSLVRSLGVIEQTVESMDTATDRIDAVMRRLRSFARLDQGDVQEVDLGTCAGEVLDLLRHRIPEKVTVTVEIGSLPALRCYPAQLNQLIMNQLVNALEAVGDEGSIALRVQADGTALELVIEDDGIGIPEADLSNIFNPGFTTKGVGLGGGLGLAIAHQVAEIHGGVISATSELGKGTRFSTRLPLMGLKTDLHEMQNNEAASRNKKESET